MAYIGNTVQNQGFSPAVDYYNGDGTTVTFTLSRPVASVAQLTAVIENVIQNPATAFTVSGNSITFTSAPPSGTNNIWVEYTSLVTTYAAISQDPSVIGDITATGGYLAEGDFGNSYIDGTIVDYVTGMARITTGPSDGITLYNGGTSARTALMTLSAAGNVGIGTSSPSQKLHVSSTTNRAYVLAESTATTSSPEAGYRYKTSNHEYLNFCDYDSQSLRWYDLTAGAERMRIDASGRVTTPYQPALVAVVTSNKTIGTSTNLSFDSISLNRGSQIAVSISNSRFTVPIAGYYKVDLSWFLVSSGNDSAIDIKVNGSILYRIGSNIAGVSGTASNLGSGGGAILNLAANDYIEICGSGTKTILGTTPVHSLMSISLLG